MDELKKNLNLALRELLDILRVSDIGGAKFKWVDMNVKYPICY